jgi:hypothetical protein
MKRRTIVLVLQKGKDFSFKDVELIVRHITGKWKSDIRPRIICLYDKASRHYDLGNIEIIPLTNELPGTWSRMQLYSPEMEKYRPFLYVDLDTAVITSIENIFDLVKDESQIITLEDFWQKGTLATGLMWFPAKSEKIQNVYKSFTAPTGNRMDYFLRKCLKPDLFWQNITTTIHDFKPRRTDGIAFVPDGADIICFHGKPRIFEASKEKTWVKTYVDAFFKPFNQLRRVTVIIPYNRDRGWLRDAIESVPKEAQLILSKGDGCWPQNFNKALPQATGDYIKYLHEDDMLTENCLRDSVDAMDSQEADFIHGDAEELTQSSGLKKIWKAPKANVTLKDMLIKNTLHSASLMYRREVFEKIGGFDETLGVGVSEEYEFNLRCLKAGLKLGYCPTILAIYRRHPEQKIRTTKKEIKLSERETVKQKYAI